LENASPAPRGARPHAVTVSELLRSVRDLLERRFPLFWVRAELTNLSLAPSGHLYFTLKDAGAQVDCVMFRSRAGSLDWAPRNGMQVEARALVTLYEPRGRGSIEDLWAFNDEHLARAIRASRIPVVVGVGHESDFTIADFAADCRAPTPTAAAELASRSRAELLGRVAECARCLSREMHRRLEYASQALDALSRRVVHPSERVRAHRQMTAQLVARLGFALSHRMHRCSAHLERLRASLVGLDPTAVLARGYSITRTEAGALLRDPDAVAEGERLVTTLAKGDVVSEVRKKQPL
jgi:exonuclease VII large subunit